MARVNKPETQETVEKTVEKEVPKKRSLSEIRRELKKNASNIDVEIMNLTSGTFVYEEGLERIYLENEGDTTIVGLDFLLRIKNRKSMKNMYISVVDVFEEKYELEDIIDILDLKKTYNGNVLTLENIDDMLMNTSFDEFSKMFKEQPVELKQLLARRSITLASRDKFDSMSKRAIIQELLGNEYVFKAS